MTTSYDDALATLYRAPLETFVAERKRLAAELKAGGDRTGAAQLTKLPRPAVSAWVVNQLFWRERAAFDALMAAAEQLRKGARDATSAHREALARLRALAAAQLQEAGHAATDATLRRVTTTLSALAVTGGFAPDPPGALGADREAPGFAGVAGMAAAAPAPSPRGAAQAGAEPGPGAHGGRAKDEAEAARERAEDERRRAEALERQRAEEERARRLAERTRLESSLQAARREVDARTRALDELRAQLGDAEETLRAATERVQELERLLTQLQTL